MVPRDTPSGSIDGVGGDIEPYRINDLEVADPGLAGWNLVIGWLLQINRLRSTRPSTKGGRASGEEPRSAGRGASRRTPARR
jgi:hypothetical protein